MNRSPMRRAPAKPRARKCAICGEPATSAMNLKAFCSPGCGLELAKLLTAKQDRAKAKHDRATDRARREAMVSRGEWQRRAQAAFNRFVRTRDEDLPCISCNRMHQGAWDAGHFFTVGARPELRFDEENVHRQCVPCNQHKHGNVLAYRAGLIARCGPEVVERLEGPHPPQKYTIPALQAITALYRQKAKALNQAKE